MTSRTTINTLAGLVAILTESDAGGTRIHAVGATGRRVLLFPVRDDRGALVPVPHGWADETTATYAVPTLPADAREIDLTMLGARLAHGAAAVFTAYAEVFGGSGPSAEIFAAPAGDGGDGETAVRVARSPRLRAVAEAPDAREGLRRLLNARCTAWGKHAAAHAILPAGVSAKDAADAMRHEAVAVATDRLTDSSMDPRVDADAMGEAVTYVEDMLHRTGYDLDADDAAYELRRAGRTLAATGGLTAVRGGDFRAAA